MLLIKSYHIQLHHTKSQLYILTIFGFYTEDTFA